MFRPTTGGVVSSVGACSCGCGEGTPVTSKKTCKWPKGLRTQGAAQEALFVLPDKSKQLLAWLCFCDCDDHWQ